MQPVQSAREYAAAVATALYEHAHRVMDLELTRLNARLPNLDPAVRRDVTATVRLIGSPSTRPSRKPRADQGKASPRCIGFPTQGLGKVAHAI